VRGSSKGVVVGLGCVAATATAWSSVTPTEYYHPHWYAALHTSDDVHVIFVLGVWVAAIFFGAPIAMKVGRYAGGLMDDYWTRHRAAKLVAIGVSLATAASVAMTFACHAVAWGEVFVDLVVGAVPCAVLAAIVLERWARLAPIPDELPPAWVAPPPEAG
jgi:MFS family permease